MSSELLPRNLVRIVVAFLIVAVVIPVFNPPIVVIEVLFDVFLYAILATSWNLLAGFAGQFSFGQAAYFGIGAYTAGILFETYGITPWAALAVGPLLAGGLSWGIGYPLFRLRADYYALATLALAEVLMITFLSWNYVGAAFGLQYRSVRFSWIDFQFNTTQIPYYYIGLALLIGALLLARAIRRSQFGLRLLAIRDDEEAAKSIGINTLLEKQKIAAISAGLAAVGGVLYAQYTLYLSPTATMSVLQTSQMILPAVLGGTGSIYGPLLGTIITEPIFWFFTFTIGSNVELLARGVALVAIVLIHTERTSADAHQQICPCFQEEDAEMTFLSVEDIGKTYGGIVAVDHVSFEMGEGEIVALIGPNGSGKTTMIDVMTGFLAKSSGRISFNGREITSMPPNKIARLGLVRTFQVCRLFGRMTVTENLLSVPLPNVKSGHRMDRVTSMLETVRLSHLANEYAANLSGGQKKLLEFARILQLDPKLVVMDEPFAGMDPSVIEDLIELIVELREAGKSFLIVEHNLAVISRLCKRALVLDEGEKIADADYETVMDDPRVRQAYLGAKRHEPSSH